MVIGKYLTLAECIKSPTAIKLGIANIPTLTQVDAMKNFCKYIYDPLCEHYACKLPFNSFFRCEDLNKAIGGAKGSQHCKGEAMDIDLDGRAIGVSNRDLFEYIRDHVEFDQLIWEFDGAWVHVSYSAITQPRKQILTASKVGKVTTYKPL